MSAAPPERLPDFFPLRLSACKTEADDFLTCFSVKGKANGQDADVGRKALAECSEFLGPYVKCMEKALKAHNAKR
ncbi:hypothetical protein DFJ74DRAFT_706187 [Hyaloraphidium curvatum]|nr:hypothetical protein DFJ74DRAFT_706187 [Hyaloraphidium curvatum]